MKSEARAATRYLLNGLLITSTTLSRQRRAEQLGERRVLVWPWLSILLLATFIPAWRSQS